MAMAIGGKIFCCTVIFYGFLMVHGPTIFAVCGLCSYTADMSTDFIVAWDLFDRGEVLYGSIVLILIYTPMLLSTYTHFESTRIQNILNGCFFKNIMLLLRPSYRQLGSLIFFALYSLVIISFGAAVTPFYTLVTGIAVTYRGQKPHHMVGSIKLLEPIAESFPQTILQTMIVLKSLHNYETSQIVSIVVSLFAMGFAISTNANFEHASTSSKVIYFFVVPLSVASRAVTCSMLAIVDTSWLIYSITAGWLIYFVFMFMSRMSTGCKKVLQQDVKKMPNYDADGESGTSSSNRNPRGEENHDISDTPDASNKNAEPHSDEEQINMDEIRETYVPESNHNKHHLVNGYDFSMIKFGRSTVIRVPLDVANQKNPTIVSVSDGSVNIQVPQNVGYSDTGCTNDQFIGYSLPLGIAYKNVPIVKSSPFPSNYPPKHITFLGKVITSLIQAFHIVWVGAPYDSFTLVGLVISFWNLSLSLVGLHLDVPQSVVITAITMSSISFVINAILAMVPQFTYVRDDWEHGVKYWLVTREMWKNRENLNKNVPILPLILLLLILLLVILLLF